MPRIPTDSCGICYGDPIRKRFVENELSKGTPHTQIELKSRELGMPVKRETIRRHLTVCPAREAAKVFGYTTDVVPSAAPGPTAPPPASAPAPATSSPTGSDFAALVRDEAARKLAAGELVIKAEHGLAAQALIDKRIDKAKDRDLMLQMGRLLGGQQSSAPPVIEGEYKNVTPLGLPSGE